MDLLSYSDIREISQNAELPLLIHPTSESIGMMLCEICDSYRPEGMILHTDCRRFICAFDALKLIDEKMHCAFCRGSLKVDDSVTSRTKFTRPSPNDNFFINRIQFQCPHCEETFPIETAKGHNRDCQKDPIRQARQPPAPLAPRGFAPLLRREVISNNIADDSPERSERLVIYHHNGVQVSTRMHSSLFTVRQLKSFVANLTNTAPEDLQMIKFIHKVLDDDALLNDVARTDGSTYLSTYSDLPDVRGKSVHLILEEVGAPHITAEQRLEQRETRERRRRRDQERMARLNITPVQPRPRVWAERHQPADYGYDDWGNPEEEW